MSTLLISHLFPSLSVFPPVISHPASWLSSQLHRSITNPNLSSLNRHTCFVLLHSHFFFFHFLLPSTAPSYFFLPYFGSHSPFVAPIASSFFFSLSLSLFLSLSLSSCCFTSPLRSSFETSEVCVRLLGKCHVNLDKKSLQLCQMIGWSIQLLTVFGWLVCVSVHVQKCTLSDLLWPWVYCQLRLIWLPQCGCKGRVVMIVLAYTGVHERRKMPLDGREGGSLKNGNWKTEIYETQKRKKKEKKKWGIPRGPVNERREWMRLQRCGGEWQSVQVKQRRETLD